MTLVYHEDSGRLGLTVGEEEFDITEELQKNGTYTKEYSYDGKNYGQLLQVHHRRQSLQQKK